MWNVKLEGKKGIRCAKTRLKKLVDQFNAQAVAYGQEDTPPEKFVLSYIENGNTWSARIGKFTEEEYFIKATLCILKRFKDNGQIIEIHDGEWVGDLRKEILLGRKAFDGIKKNVPDAHEPNFIMGVLNQKKIPFTASELKEYAPELFGVPSII